MNSLVIRYQTSSLIPAPYANAIEIKVNFTSEGINYSFEQEYLDRSQLTEEEILEEGFGIDDNLKLEGKLPKTWADSTKAILEKSGKLFLDELEDNQDFWDIDIAGENYYPKNPEQWKTFIEEFQQAAIEQNKLESPLCIYVVRAEPPTKIEYCFIGSFENQTLTLEKDGIQKELPWSKLQPLLKDFYSGDFVYEKAQEKYPTKTGLFINFGDELWFELGKSFLIKPSKITSWLENQ